MTDYQQPDNYPEPEPQTEVIAEYTNTNNNDNTQDPEEKLKAQFKKFLNTPKTTEQQMHIWADTPEELPKGSCMFAGDKPFQHADGRYCTIERMFCPHRICTDRTIYHDCHIRRLVLNGANL